MHDPDRLQGRSVAIIGACGHTGLRLGVKLALAGASTRLLDTNQVAVDPVNVDVWSIHDGPELEIFSTGAGSLNGRGSCP